MDTHTYTHRAPEAETEPEAGTPTPRRFGAPPTNIDRERQRQTERIHIHTPRSRGPGEVPHRRVFEGQIAKTLLSGFSGPVGPVLGFSGGMSSTTPVKASTPNDRETPQL